MEHILEMKTNRIQTENKKPSAFQLCVNCFYHFLLECKLIYNIY